MEIKRSVKTAAMLLLADELVIIPTMSESEKLIPDKGLYHDAIAMRTPTFDRTLYDEECK